MSCELLADLIWSKAERNRKDQFKLNFRINFRFGWTPYFFCFSSRIYFINYFNSLLFINSVNKCIIQLHSSLVSHWYNLAYFFLSKLSSFSVRVLLLSQWRLVSPNVTFIADEALRKEQITFHHSNDGKPSGWWPIYFS